MWSLDILYMPRSNAGYRYILTFAEKVSSYLAAIPIKNLNNSQVAAALPLFLGIFPAMDTILTDHGRADFGEQFTQLLEEFNIKHTGEIPRRSQACGAAEMGNKLLQTQLARICASHLWEEILALLFTKNCSKYQQLFSI